MTGTFWRLGSENKTPIFQSRWGGDRPVELSESYLDNSSNPVRCGEFFDQSGVAWDTRKVRQVFSPDDTEKIIHCTITP
ncbi:hypothetical protein V6N13_072146 [Hibiscus sabdariffa]